MRAQPVAILLLLLFAVLMAAAPDIAHAQSPFAVPDQQTAAPAPQPGIFGGFTRYIMTMQQEYYRAMAGALRAVNLQQSMAAVWGLFSISFLYGVFHAAGPGHGKIVVTSYILADEREVKRGIFIAVLSAFVQAITAILAVGILAVILGLTHRATADALPMIERASFALIAAVGLWLIWRALRGEHSHHHDHDHKHEHHHHAHTPMPAEIRAAKDMRGMLAMILSVGLRPCTGAVLVLLFSVTQGAFLIGVISAMVMSAGTALTVSTLALMAVFSKNLALRVAGRVDSPWAARLERGLKIGGGSVIFLFGVTLLVGSFTMPPQPLL